MPTPVKPFTVLTTEKKSHRTKAELEQRKAGEEALCSGVALKERSQVKNNEIAHKEFLRVNKLLKNIEKNDALYESVINRYAILQAECTEFEEKRDLLYNMIIDLKKEFKELTDDIKQETKINLIMDFTNNLSKYMGQIINLDKQIQTKRKMLLDIEKENIMTIASALRSIPKKVKDNEDEDPMANLLKRRG